MRIPDCASRLSLSIRESPFTVTLSVETVNCGEVSIQNRANPSTARITNESARHPTPGRAIPGRRSSALPEPSGTSTRRRLAAERLPFRLFEGATRPVRETIGGIWRPFSFADRELRTTFLRWPRRARTISERLCSVVILTVPLKYSGGGIPLRFALEGISHQLIY